MAAITATEPHGSAGHDDHPSDLIYWKVFGVLLALTALEVSTYWWPHSWHKVTAVLLIVMMAIKFSTVALYFMHLKNDAKVLKRVFFAGIALAVAVYCAALGAMVFFNHSGTKLFNDPPQVRQMPPPATDPPPIIKPIQHH
ncbi:MAG: cytochrome C oxidase subunit IV family protein [Acidimicrobiales bacterium]